MSAQPATFISPDAMFLHWQGHRRLTRRVIEAFPEEHLFSFAIGGMRSFGALALELLSMAVPTVQGIVTGDWSGDFSREPKPKTDILRAWDRATDDLARLWPQIPGETFHTTVNAFGQYEGKVHDLLLYIIDNEIHHRGQGYVYLRALAVEPPPFYERQ